MNLLTSEIYFANRITWWVYPYSLSYQTYKTTVSSLVIVASLSKIHGAVVPIISVETNSLFIEYLIPRLKLFWRIFRFLIDPF